jgi:hypothetical protein
MRTLIAALATAALLAGCSSVGLNPTTAARVQAIDYVNDDIGSVLIAFDIPLALEPVPDGSVMVFTLGGRTLRTVLTRADLDDAVQALPPPKADRTYYLFGFSAADRASIKALQAGAHPFLRSPRTAGRRRQARAADRQRHAAVGPLGGAGQRRSGLRGPFGLATGGRRWRTRSRRPS